tara:strand:- start:552 stop:1121 length:570 start_codon:yes stop_codon:yes gene_type:complete
MLVDSNDYSGPYLKKFAIPFANYKIPDWDKKKEQLMEIYDEYSKDNLKEHTDHVTDYSTNKDCARYTDLIDPILREDFTHILSAFGHRGYDFRIGAAWFQYYESSHGHPVHNHGFGGYSSALFIEYDPKSHRPTTFVSPFLNNFDGNVVDYMPEDIEEGHLLVFPTSLLHYAPTNTTNVRRTILSMNIF